MNEPIIHPAADPSPTPAGDDQSPRTGPAAPDAMRRFAPDRLAFFQRIAEGNVRDRSGSSMARAHLVALENRVAQAAQALELGHLASARAFLEMARRDFDAAVDVLPAL
jgi:hypothetical protein